MELCRISVLLSIVLINRSDCEFAATPGTDSGCEGDNVTLSWNITNYASVSTVQWKRKGTTIMSQSGSGTPTLSAGETNYEHGGDGTIVIKGVQLKDTGAYSCHITYPPGSKDYASSSTAMLNILVPPSYPPCLDTVIETDSITYTCIVTSKGTPEVNVTIKIGSEEKSTAAHTVPSDNQDDISCCITGDAFQCLPVTDRCLKLGGNESFTTTTTPSTTQGNHTNSTIPTTVTSTSITPSTTQGNVTNSTIPTTVTTTPKTPSTTQGHNTSSTTSVTRNTTDSFLSTLVFALLVVCEIIVLIIVAAIVIYCFLRHCIQNDSNCKESNRHSTRQRKRADNEYIENDIRRWLTYQPHVNEGHMYMRTYEDGWNMY